MFTIDQTNQQKLKHWIIIYTVQPGAPGVQTYLDPTRVTYEIVTNLIKSK